MVVYSTVSAVDRLPQFAADIFFGEFPENQKYCRVVDYDVKNQQLNQVMYVEYTNESDLVEKLTGLKLISHDVVIKDRQVHLPYKFNPFGLNGYAISTNGDVDYEYKSGFSVTTKSAHSVRYSFMADRCSIESCEQFAYTICKGDTDLTAGTLLESLFDRSRLKMKQVGEPDFIINFLTQRAEIDANLAQIEKGQDQWGHVLNPALVAYFGQSILNNLVRDIGLAVTRLTLMSRGYNPIIFFDNGKINYDIFVCGGEIELSLSQYFITSSTYSCNHVSARKNGEKIIQLGRIVPLIKQAISIPDLRENMLSLARQISVNYDSVFLFTHRTVGTGKSQIFSQTARALYLDSLKSAVEKIKHDDPDFDTTVKSIQKIKEQAEKWGDQEDEDDSRVKEDTDQEEIDEGGPSDVGEAPSTPLANGHHEKSKDEKNGDDD